MGKRKMTLEEEINLYLSLGLRVAIIPLDKEEKKTWMLAIGHYMLGATIATTILLFLKEKKHDMLIMFTSGVWAMLPDLPSLWGDYTFDDSPLMNLFHFHQIVDTMPDTPLIASWFILVYVCLLIIYLRVVKKWRIEEKSQNWVQKQRRLWSGRLS